MPSRCGRYVIAFNGEIYNHLDLRQELAGTGAAPGWRGHSDTETLLASIANWGLDKTLQRAYGMFALAVWDRKTQTLSLARDRIGEKPLYWGWAGKALVFGSELKALRAHPDFVDGICRDALTQYFRYAYVPAPRSIHPSIYKLEPGCILEVAQKPPAAPPEEPLRPGQRQESLSIRRYWSLAEMLTLADPITDEAEALAQLEEGLSRAVGRQMLADVPLGAFLSGGIDSSLIAALMQARSAHPVRTFTIGFDNPAYNEAPHAVAVARHLGTDHTEMTVTDAEAREVIPQLQQLYDEPFADSSQIPTFLVCRAARQHVTVALSGDAGDELFGGYTRHLWGPRLWNRLGRIPAPLRRGLGQGIAAVPAVGWDCAGRLLGAVNSRLAVSHPGTKAGKLAEHLKHADSLDGLYRGLISIWNRPPVNGAVLTATLLDDPLPGCLEQAPAARMMVQDMRSYLPDDILCKVDRAAMGVSLETRVPFLDPQVLQLSAQLPADLKIRGGQGKWALRQILYKHVPRALIERPKTGFGIPLGEWLRGPLRPWAEELLSGSALARSGLLEAEVIRKTWTQHLRGSHQHEHKIWSVLMLQSWLQEQG
jgi:asparagine synthase (glutamine-hydrolysing)